MGHRRDIKIQLGIILKEGPPKSEMGRQSRPSLKDKIQYAIDNIDCNTHCKQQAIEFLRKVQDKILSLPGATTEANQLLLDMIRPALSDYGSEYKGMGD